MTMDMEFQVGQSVTFGFDIGGSAPAPPTPSTDYAPFTLSPVIIQGTSGTFFAPTATPFGIATRNE